MSTTPHDHIDPPKAGLAFVMSEISSRMVKSSSLKTLMIGALADVLAIYAVIFAVLLYLEVPLANVCLYSTSVVLQAALGTYILKKLLGHGHQGLLFFLGPGLILGGAISFATFQITGRGYLGLSITHLIGLGAVASMLRQKLPRLGLESRRWELLHIVGLGALILMSEFNELLPVAAVIFAIGWLSQPKHQGFAGPKRLLIAAGGVLLFLLLQFRQRYWWTITDDYLLFEVITQHLKVSSPLQDWGITSFARYHWLPYGWAGLLDFSAASPAPLVTLTRVMPTIYALSMAASLLLIARILSKSKLDMQGLLPIWALLAVGRFDWSGTGTAGTYAVISALALICAIAVNNVATVKVTASLLLFLPIVVLTKFPSVFVATLLLSTVCFHSLANKVTSRKATYLVWSTWAAATLACIVIGVWLGGIVVQGLYEVVRINRQLGQLSLYGATFAGPALVLGQIWLWLIPLSMTILIFLKSGIKGLQHMWLLPVVSFATVAGPLFDMFITANGDNHKYFSGPMYFIASLSFLMRYHHLSAIPEGRQRIHWVWKSLVLVATGILWTFGEGVQGFWNTVNLALGGSPNLKVELLRFVTNDARFAATMLVFGLLALGLARRSLDVRLMDSLFLALVLLTLVHDTDNSLNSYKYPVPKVEEVAHLGQTSERLAGTWLRKNSNQGDLVASSQVVDGRAADWSSFTLAAWSQREFLGPSIGERLSVDDQGVIETLTDFFRMPDGQGCSKIYKLNVRWLITDSSSLANMIQKLCAVERFRSQEIRIFELRFDSFQIGS